MRLHITLDDGATAELRGLRDRAGDLRPPLEAVAAEFRRHTAEVIASGGPTGERWKPLARGYVAGKQRGRPMELTGRLAKSLTQKGARYAVTKIGRNTLQVGTSNPVAHLHHLGTVRRTVRKTGRSSGAVPRRRLYAIDRGMRQRWEGRLLRWIMEGR